MGGDIPYLKDLRGATRGVTARPDRPRAGHQGGVIGGAGRSPS